MRMSDLDLHGQRVLIRLDLNAPIAEQQIVDDSRLRACQPTIQAAIDAGAKVGLLSHWGQPKQRSADHSLAPVAAWLQQHVSLPVRLVDDWIDGVELSDQHLTLCENVRFLKGETDNDPELAKKMAALCDVFVMDAFASAHRHHASTVGITQYAPKVAIGPLIEHELNTLDTLQQAASPVVAIIGGSKISTKLPLLRALTHQVNYLIVGGGLANTLLAACDYPVGQSLIEPSLLEQSRAFLHTLPAHTYVLLPSDVVVQRGNETTTITCHEVQSDDIIMDIGPDTQAHGSSIIQQAKTIIWNGPMGAFEDPRFCGGTQAMAQAMAQSDAYTVAGGGDTIAAIEAWQKIEDFDYISTGGGAFLSYLQDQRLPAIEAMQQRWTR